ncbi:MAG TPA: hypothetical protein VFG10_05790 [Saprospiraceae bacterium]|nr:hypothetical protein [Saprospiraceae bacterium]
MTRKRIHIYLTIGLLITLLPFVSYAQSTDATVNNDSLLLAGDVHIDYKYYGDSTVIRWGYDHPQLWYHQCYHPVTLWRRDVTNKGDYEKIAEIMPWDSSKIESLAAVSSHQDMLVVVLENMYRHWDNTLFKDYASVLERTDNFYNRWSLVHFAADRDAAAATAAGLRYVDNNLKPKITYAYKVTTHGNTASDYKVAFAVKKNFVPVIFNISEGDSLVTITWEKKLHDYHFSAYWIEQSTDSKSFTRMNSIPYVQMTDVSIKEPLRYYAYAVATENYKKKYYRVIGLDAFGDESKPSESLVAMGRDRTAPAEASLTADTSLTHHSKLLSWTHPNPGDVKMYNLERSFANETVVIRNWAKATMHSQKDSVNIEGVYKYRLIAVDTAGNESFSQPVYTKVYDLIPPAAPVKPHALADTTGRIFIQWDDHPEKDVIGYNIYAADGKQRNFIKLNAQIYRSTVYVDSIDMHLLNEKRYYRVAAVDDDYMISQPSEIVEVDRPDVIPPAPALIGDYRVMQEGIRLTILPSSSRDVVRHELRRKETEGEWKTIETFTQIPSSYLDKNVVAEHQYTYRILAIDKSGHESNVVKDIVLTALPAQLETPVISYTVDGNVMTLSILMTHPDFSMKFNVYRANDTGSYTKHAVAETYSFSEKIPSDLIFRYRVRMTTADGRTSPFSNEITTQIASR